MFWRPSTEMAGIKQLAVLKIAKLSNSGTSASILQESGMADLMEAIAFTRANINLGELSL